MASITSYFLIPIILLIVISIYAKQFAKTKLYFVAKPLTMLFIIALPLLEIREDYSPYAYLVITGLIFSLLGDLFLLYPDKYFANGLYSFLVAHIFYIIAFNKNVNEYSIGIIFIVLIYILIVSKTLVPKLGGMKYPVLFYIFIISAMLYSALNMDLQMDGISYVGIGAILFAISDTVLAFNKFYKKFSFAEPIVLSTYFVAQLMFAMTI
ncbi:MAG: lysoplasmalogenase [Melioribacteraceae bacterium]|jgi:uncharacterized membrane protein YhhN|nr:lysoplasmalogenase [Melioribacteraceae bacterium]